jgi:hypothetical protein
MRPALDDQDAEALFELLDAGRERRRRDISDRRRQGEVPRARQRRQVLQGPYDHHTTAVCVGLP